MAKRKSRRSKPFVNTKEGFVMLPLPLLKSKEVISLSPNAFRLMTCLQMYYYPDKGKADLSVRQAASLIGATDKTANKAFKELQQKGFIEVATESSFAPKGQNRATGWRLTWCDTATKKASNYWNLEQRKVLENAEKFKAQTKQQIEKLNTGRKS